MAKPLARSTSVPMAAKAAGDSAELDRAGALGAARVGAQALATRGKSQVGDKTVLDALVPSLDALAGAGDASAPDALSAMVAAAHSGVQETTALRSRRGRAA
jgi:dihydroxyacetone kinase